MRILSSFRSTAELPLVFSLNLLAIMTALVSLGPPLLAQTDEQRRDFERDDQGGQLRRDQWFYRQRAFPYDKIPGGVRFAAWNERRALEAKAHARALANGLGEPAWTFIGPEDNLFWGGSSGRITALAVDPRNSQVVWAGAADGGVWKTTDGGVHWIPVADGQPSLSIGALTLDPSNPDTVFVGTGEGNFSGDEYGGIGILKSTDGGATWTTLTAAFSSGSTITQIAVSPASSRSSWLPTAAGSSVLPTAETRGGTSYLATALQSHSTRRTHRLPGRPSATCTAIRRMACTAQWTGGKPGRASLERIRICCRPRLKSVAFHSPWRLPILR